MEGFPYTSNGEVKHLILPVSDGYVPLKLIADAIGLSWVNQRASLVAKFSNEIGTMKCGRVFVAAAKPSTIQKWLNGVDARKLKQEVVVLHQHFAMHLAPYLRQMLGDESAGCVVEQVQEVVTELVKPVEPVKERGIELISTQKMLLSDMLSKQMSYHVRDSSRAEQIRQVGLQGAETGVVPVHRLVKNMATSGRIEGMFRRVSNDDYVVQIQLVQVGGFVTKADAAQGHSISRISDAESAEVFGSVIGHAKNDPLAVLPYEAELKLNPETKVWSKFSLSEVKQVPKVKRAIK